MALVTLGILLALTFVLVRIALQLTLGVLRTVRWALCGLLQCG